MTAVEWLQTEIDNKDMGEIPIWIYEFLEQAKEMEKQQIIDAHISGYDSSGESAKDYYNFYYGSKGSDEKINLVEIPQEQLEKERNPNYKYFDTSSQTEISDEEIEKSSENAWSDYEYEEGNLYSTTFKGGWKLAIKWYREQLKQK